MLVVHHLGISQSDRIVWLCEELEIPYELIRYERDAETRMAPAAYKALYPFGTAPVIHDGALTLAESGAIIEYIIHRHGGGRLAITPDSPHYPDFLFWFHFANGSLMPAEMVRMVVTGLGVPLEQGPFAMLLERSERAYGMIEARLGEAEYFAGPAFSAADIIMLFPLTTMRAFLQRDLTPYPNLRAYLARIGERPAFQRAMAKADPGMTPLLS